MPAMAISASDRVAMALVHDSHRIEKLEVKALKAC